MTVFLAYALPSSSLSILTVMQAEIPGQDQYGYDVVPNFFRGMPEVSETMQCISTYTSLISVFSNFQATTSVTHWAPQETQAHYDEE
jgi:hypothetical protein